jgi:putative tricarboxylic transport membrane protein
MLPQHRTALDSKAIGNVTVPEPSNDERTITMHMPERSTTSITRYAEMLVAVIVIVLGFVVIWETQDVDAGPKQVGLVIGIAQVLAGVWYLTEVLAHRRQNKSKAASANLVACGATDWHRLAIVAFGLVAYAVLLERAGFIIASTILILVVAFGLGSQRLLRDGLSAVLVSTIVFVTFDLALDVNLPAGWLSGIL